MSHLLMIYVTVPDDFESATATVDDLVECDDPDCPICCFY